jgi:hypothetical protein
MHKEAEASNVPKLAIEYDPRNTDEYTPQLIVSLEAVTVIKPKSLPEPQTLKIERRYLKVNIRNDGPAVAEHCKAELRVISCPTGAVCPSTDSKLLRWDNGVKYADIGANGGRELLHVVLSDSRNSRPCFAFISRPDVVKNLSLMFFRAQDGMGSGEFELEVIVSARTGQRTSGVFRVRVTENWQELAMERIR